MDPFPISNILTLIVFFILSGFFSSSETICTAVSHIKLQNLIKEKPRHAKLLERIYENPRRLLTGILIGNNVANVAATALFTTLLLNFLSSIGFQNLAVNMSIITGVVTVLLLIFGEITPKSLALKHPERWIIYYAKPLLFFLFVLSPVIYLFENITILLTKAFRISQSDNRTLVTLDELKTMVDLSQQEGVLEQDKKDMLQGIFDFSDTVVREIMTPRTDTVCISVKSTVQDAIQLIIEKGHSRIPVYEGKVDNTVGVIYAKDLLQVPKTEIQESLRQYLRQAVFIPESKNVEELLQQMKKTRFHLAIVVDEYGGMAGIVTLEDIVEEIIGEIQDEYDTDETPMVTAIKDGTVLVDAAMNIKELGDIIAFNFPESDDYDTIAGFVLSLLGEFPTRGTTVTYENLEITVKEIRKRRIISLVVKSTPIETNDLNTNPDA